MSEPVLQSPLHSFGLSAQARPADESCGVWANEVPLQGHISLRGNPADTAFQDELRALSDNYKRIAGFGQQDVA